MSVSNADQPIIGWHNLVTASNVVATSASASHPASNLGNPATHLYWLADDDVSPPDNDQCLTIMPDFAAEIDYVAIAGHNLGSAQVLVSVEGFIDAAWQKIVASSLLADDGPALFRFTPQVLPQVRLRLRIGNADPRIAVLYAGKLLIMQRGIYAGHTPITHGRKVDTVDAVSESGQFLGQIVTRETRQNAAKFRLLTPDWYRTNFDPFLAQRKPFFVVWRPDTYPDEIGYCWLTNDPAPAPESPSNLIAVELRMRGIAGTGRARVLWTPLSIGADVWFDPSDLSTMRQDRGGASATIAAAVDAPVGSRLNKGTLGGWATAPSDAARPILRSAGGLYWLGYDGVDDCFDFDAGLPAESMIECCGIERAESGVLSFIFGNGAGAMPYGHGWWPNGHWSALGSVERFYGADTDTGTFVLTSHRNEANEKIRRNGIELGSEAASAVGTNRFLRLGTYSGAEFHSGREYQSVMCKAADIESRISSFEQFVAEKSGVLL